MAALAEHLRELDKAESFADAIEDRMQELRADAVLMAEFADAEYSPEQIDAALERIAIERLHTDLRRAEEAAAADEWERRQDRDLLE
jgi:hypothetical protein